MLGYVCGAIFFAGNKLLTESGREFFAGRKFDFVLNARIVWNNHTAARGVTEEADDGGMRASDNADDAALGAAGTGRTAEAGNFGDDVVAVHGVFDVIARNEEVAVEIGDGDVRNDEAVTVLMENEAAFDFVAGNGFVLGKFLGRRLWRGTWLGGRLLWAGRLAKKEAAVGKLFDEASFFQLGEHLKEGAAAGFADLDALRVRIVRTWGTAVLCPYTFVLDGAIFYDGLAGEKVRPEYLAPAPDVSESEAVQTFRVLNLDALVRMKLTSYRLKDRVHLLDLYGVGLIDETWAPLRSRLK